VENIVVVDNEEPWSQKVENHLPTAAIIWLHVPEWLFWDLWSRGSAVSRCGRVRFTRAVHAGKPFLYEAILVWSGGERGSAGNY